jgi:diguanylate cyclase (GGDEF)-like protein/PAS domain S-box-containing protein
MPAKAAFLNLPYRHKRYATTKDQFFPPSSADKLDDDSGAFAENSMQNQLLDITIIGCLVLLFASAYRKRASSMVQYWTAGWLLILLHFIALLPTPASVLLQNSLQAISEGALIACGVVFLFAARGKSHHGDFHVDYPLIAGSIQIGFVVLAIFGVNAHLPYFLLVAACELAWLLYAVRVRRTASGIGNLLIAATAASSGWLIWSILHNRVDIGVSAILMQVYLCVGIVYIDNFRRNTGGALTVVFGLFAWAAVFPAGEFCDHLGIISQISPEFWNVPKYFVAFGMILILLEEEIFAANEASKHYRVLFEANPHPMWTYDRETLAFQGVNDAAVAQYGYSREQFLSMTIDDLRSASLDDESPELPGEGVCRHKKSDGSVCIVDVATHHMNSNGRELAFSLVQDVTEREQLHEQLSHQAHHDLLTGLANRAWLEEKLRKTLAHSERYNRQSALLCLDVDRFKQINDTYGHGVGDLCLQEVARRLNQRVRSMDIAARIGGEEFSLLLHEIVTKKDAESVANLILASLRAPIQAGNFTIELTASIGIAIFPYDGKDVATLWRNADSAMYRAKRAGGNQYLCMSPEISQLTSEATEMERSLRRALRANELEVHYQPLYSVDGELHSLEALLRFRHPVMGYVSPAKFVPIAEESGLIVPLGDWVLNEVCRQTAEWQRSGLATVRTALNISPLQITRPDFAGRVVEVLTLHGVDPNLIGMEITETAMMRNIGEASRQIKQLADLGVAFSVDDFGTGYSSLGQLDTLSVHSLKIDRTFVDRICRPEGTYTIVNAIISMAHSLRLEVVAEGVETVEQWSCLRDLGCDTVQGFLFSKAIPAADIPSLLTPGRIHSHGIQLSHGFRVA